MGEREIGEFDLIAKYFAPLATDPAALGLKDDAALVDLPPGEKAVITKDVMVAGVHFPIDTDPTLVAQKLLRVNLSDLASMGAKPVGYWLGCQLPRRGAEAWVAKFCAGLKADQEEFAISLMGGDTVATPGPVALSLTAMGTCPDGEALRRSGAKPGDEIWVSGTIGDGYLGLKIAEGENFGLDPEDQAYLRGRLDRPSPRVSLGLALRDFASAAIDISDGLAADAGHIANASDVTLSIETKLLPLSTPAATLVKRGDVSLSDLLSGGDDFELLFTTPLKNFDLGFDMARESMTRVTRIGDVMAGSGKVRLTQHGTEITPKNAGFTHF